MKTTILVIKLHWETIFQIKILKKLSFKYFFTNILSLEINKNISA